MIKFKNNDREFKLETYKARLLDYLYLNNETLNLSITISNNQKNISKLNSLFEECNIIIDKFTYECKLVSTSTLKITDFLIQLDFSFDCKVFGLERTIVLIQPQTIINISSSKSVEAIFKYKNISNEVLKNISINEWKVLELQPQKEFIIDGVKKLVTDYKKADFYDFPKLDIGKNIINVVGDLSKVELTIKYKESW